MTRRTIAVLALGLVCACGNGDDGGAADETTSDAPPPPPPAPGFVEPASDFLDVPVDRAQDVVLGVVGALPGTTRALIDSRSRGTLPATDPFATLTATELTLRLRGAMVEGSHTMQLVNDGAEDPLLSKEITVNLQPVPAPALTVELADTMLEGRALATSGRADDPLLLILDQLAVSAPVLHVVPAEDGRWADDLARTIPMFGYVRGPAETGFAATAVRTFDDDGNVERLRVAWRIGYPGTAIALVDTAWGLADLSTTPVVAIDRDDEALGPFEYAELRRPVLLPKSLVVEALIATDVESPRPGDHALLQASLAGIPATVGPFSRVSVGPRTDLDHVGAVVDPALVEVGGAGSIAARMGGVFPVVLVADPGHGRLELAEGIFDDIDLAFASITGATTTFVGAFGSRTIVAFDEDAEPPLAIARVDDWGLGGAHLATTTTEVLPPVPTGAPSFGILAGVPTLVLPYGAEADTYVVRPYDGTLVVEALGIPCQQVALVPGASVPDTPLGLACVQGQNVRAGTLTAETGT